MSNLVSRKLRKFSTRTALRATKVGQRSKFKDYYTLTSTSLGTGYFANVSLARRHVDPHDFAVKRVSKVALQAKNLLGQLEQIRREVKILNKLRHAYIVSFIEFFEEEEYLFIVMEHVTGGSLLEKVETSNEPVPEDVARTVIRKISEALKYCHDAGVVHRDLKPANIMLTGYKNSSDFGDIKIIDFNLSSALNPDIIESEMMETLVGTASYIAPEVVCNSPKYNYKCDIWSLGLICFFMLSGGSYPFVFETDHQPLTKQQLFDRIKQGKFYFEPQNIWSNISKGAKHFVSSLVEVNPDKRLNYDQILHNHWIQANGAQVEIASNQKKGDIQYKQKQRVALLGVTYDAVGCFSEAML